MGDLRVEWQDGGRKAQNPPDPAYPKGKDVDGSLGATATCSVELPYPAPQCGVWIVTCPDCGLSVGFTAAGRIDDPRKVTVACKLGETGTFSEGKLDATDEGDLRLAISADEQHGVVRIDFGKKVAWLGLPPQAALEMAAALTKHAQALQAVRRKPQ